MAPERNAATIQALSETPWDTVGPPNLPLELILAIFESCTQQEMAVLCRVSKTCQSWINPLLYHTVILTRRQTQYLFWRTVKAFSKCDTHASFLAAHTKVISIPFASISDHVINKILVACPNITTLSVRSAKIVNQISQSQNFNRLTHLNLPGLFNSPQILPASLTHLSCDINGWTDLNNTNRWNLFLRENPKITHLVLSLPPILHSTRYEYRGTAARIKLLSILALLPATIIRIVIIFSYSQNRFLLKDVYLTSGRFPESQRVVWVHMSNQQLSDLPGYFVSPLSINASLGWNYSQGNSAEDIWALGDRIAHRPLSESRHEM